jgi:hypothetical protein
MTVSYAWHLLMNVRASARSGMYRCGEHGPDSPAFRCLFFYERCADFFAGAFAD